MIIAMFCSGYSSTCSTLFHKHPNFVIFISLFLLTYLKFHVILLLVQMEEYPSLAEGIGLENRQAGQTARGFESLFLRHTYI